MRETIGFIGTGGMGEPMALNLLKAGFPLRVYNRTPEKARPLAEQGGRDRRAAGGRGGGRRHRHHDGGERCRARSDHDRRRRAAAAAWPRQSLPCHEHGSARDRAAVRRASPPSAGRHTLRLPSSAGPTPPRPGSSRSSSPGRGRRASAPGQCSKRWGRGSSRSGTRRTSPMWSSCAATS